MADVLQKLIFRDVVFDAFQDLLIDEVCIGCSFVDPEAHQLPCIFILQVPALNDLAIALFCALCKLIALWYHKPGTLQPHVILPPAAGFQKVQASSSIPSNLHKKSTELWDANFHLSSSSHVPGL
eukprot:CAMPEP_0177758904 /NCGR_PEP_ID=MMETSP0491_2-20121128/4440_1 /TAXON_ID=63592 /ORGANISM="Tetraselmis chuii, Strain PLY429" /LENGTH=124 /DNA_ID=CAMNT_0019274683 /DNA_START=215 /DNA_END=590 /DNA_ORIENTATION=-